MSKKKIKLIIWILVLALVLGTIFYLNRTIKGDFISEYLNEKEVVRVNVTKTNFDDEDLLDKDLSPSEIDEFVRLLEDAKFKIIRTNGYDVTDHDEYNMNCIDARGKSIVHLSTSGRNVIRVYLRAPKEEIMTYRIQNEEWFDKLKFLIEG